MTSINFQVTLFLWVKSMVAAPRVNIKNLITTRLLTVVFSIYLVVTLFLTITHILAEYYDTKDTIIHDMQASQKTFEPGLSQSIWTGNKKQLLSLVQGIEKIPFIVGVQVNTDVLSEILVKGIAQPVQTWQVTDLIENVEDNSGKMEEEGSGWSISVEMDQLTPEDKKELETGIRKAIEQLNNLPV